MKKYKVETMLTLGNSKGEVTLEHITFPTVEEVSAENYASALRQATEKVGQALRDGGNFKWNSVSMSNPSGYIIGTLKDGTVLECFVEIVAVGKENE